MLMKIQIEMKKNELSQKIEIFDLLANLCTQNVKIETWQVVEIELDQSLALTFLQQFRMMRMNLNQLNILFIWLNCQIVAVLEKMRASNKRCNEAEEIQAVLKDLFDEQIVRLDKFEKSVDSRDDFWCEIR